MKHAVEEFADFGVEAVVIGDCELEVRSAGSGPVVLLVDGHPGFDVASRGAGAYGGGVNRVVPDLPRDGHSKGPTPPSDHAACPKRAIAEVMAALMGELGHEQYSIVGHDRGSHVAPRLALDYGDRVERAVLMDCIHISEYLPRADTRFATKWWHWFFSLSPRRPSE